MTSFLRFKSLLLTASLVVLPFPLPHHASAQITWQDLVVTGGMSGEGYRGNLPTVAISAVDSTREASAAVGEFGLRGRVTLLNREEQSLDFRFDAGLRQFSASGFKVRDYAPREWVGRGDLQYRHVLEDLGELWVEGGASGRGVEDRPPMPLFMQPAYNTVNGRIRLQRVSFQGAFLDAQILGEIADYSGTTRTPQLDLLDRKVLGLETGITWGPNWTFRVHTAFRVSGYENQGTFDPADPHRRDRTLSLGATWTIRSTYFAQLGVEGTLNRSNSSRPEYNAYSVRAVASSPLSEDLSLTFFANLTAKGYTTKTDFARLIPGEEADNASVVYVELARPLLVNLNGAVRLGWNRAETDIGDSYYERFGATFLLRYRPWQR